MVLCLLWVAQFFQGEGDSTPVIWLDQINNQKTPGEEHETFIEFQEDAESK